MSTVLPYCGNWRADRIDRSGRVRGARGQHAHRAAAPTASMATYRIPLTSCRFEKSRFSRRTENASHIRRATMNHMKAIAAKGMTYSPTRLGSAADELE